MPKSRLMLTLPVALMCAGLAAPRAMAQPTPTVVGQTMTSTAIVETVDMKTRQVLLSDPSGGLATIVAGPEVRNLSKVGPGDKVVVTSHRAVAVRLDQSTGPLAQPSFQAAEVRAARGQLPAGGTIELITVNVRIDSVDEATHKVAFTRADGSTGEVEVKNPQLQTFASGLKPGDNVRLSYLRSVSIQVQRP